MQSVIDKERRQATPEEVKTAILLFSGPLVTFRAFQKFAPRLVRNHTKEEFAPIISLMDIYGKVVSIRIALWAQKVDVFIKKDTSDIALLQKINSLITIIMRRALRIAAVHYALT